MGVWLCAYVPSCFIVGSTELFHCRFMIMFNLPFQQSKQDLLIFFAIQKVMNFGLWCLVEHCNCEKFRLWHREMWAVCLEESQMCRCCFITGVFFWLACLTSLGPFFHPQSVRGDFAFTKWSVCLIWGQNRPQKFSWIWQSSFGKV